MNTNGYQLMKVTKFKSSRFKENSHCIESVDESVRFSETSCIAFLVHEFTASFVENLHLKSVDVTVGNGMCYWREKM